MNRQRVGVLALQGASAPHRAAFARLGIEAREVRTRRELEGLTHLVLPGGESTTLRHLLDLFEMSAELVRRHASGELVLFGTCAGAILLARTQAARPLGFGILEAEIERNAYGSQIDSFAREIELELGESTRPRLRAVFIRAPRFRDLSAELRVLARIEDGPVALQAPGLLATTFHPELSGTDVLHEHFLAMPPVRRTG